MSTTDPMTEQDDCAGERWFSVKELTELARPTMDRAIEAIERGDAQGAVDLCEEMRREWRNLHDTMAGMIAGLVSFIQQRLGEDAIADAWTDALGRGWRQETARIQAADRRQVARGLAATWRAHSGSGRGANPAAFRIEEDTEKITFTMNPCGSGQRLWRNGAYEGEHAFTLTERAHTWTFGRENFPVYCTHCAFMNEILPIKWYGLPLFPAETPTNYDHDPCIWYWYKNPSNIPDHYWRRYGLSPTDDNHPSRPT
ncbi:MAG: hypothetical protein ACR2LX_02860 [Jatrophihabitans sp.]